MSGQIEWEKFPHVADKILSTEFCRRRGDKGMTVVSGFPHLDYFPPIKPIVCLDGFTLSVQAGDGHYCLPRKYRPTEGIWQEWEVGFPSQREKILLPWAEEKSRPTQTVYGYVPSHVVMTVFQSHGGWLDDDPIACLKDAAEGGGWAAVIRQAMQLLGH